MPIESSPQDPPESLRKELEAKGIEHEAFVMDDLCPAGNLTKAETLKALKAAMKRANARCYAFVSLQSGASFLSQVFVMFFHVSYEGLPGQ